MNYAKLMYDGGSYACKSGSNLEMQNLGCFLSSDVGCLPPLPFRGWALNHQKGVVCGVSGNISFLEHEDGYIYLSDLYSDEEIPTELKLSVKQFLQLLNDWEQKVCKPKPQEVMIKHENGQFVIETKNETSIG